jgi:hypothetical protein
VEKVDRIAGLTRVISTAATGILVAACLTLSAQTTPAHADADLLFGQEVFEANCGESVSAWQGKFRISNSHQISPTCIYADLEQLPAIWHALGNIVQSAVDHVSSDRPSLVLGDT